MKDKIVLFCDIDMKVVIECEDVDNFYFILFNFQEQGFDKFVCDYMKLECKELDMMEWKDFVMKVKNLFKIIIISFVGKYVEFQDVYILVVELFCYVGYVFDVDVKIKWINVEEVIESNI